MLSETGNRSAALGAAKDLDGKIVGLEGKILQVSNTSVSIEEGITSPMKLYEKLAGLAGNIVNGRGSGSGEGLPPTQGEIEVNNLYKQQIEEYQRALADISHTQIGAFNASLKQAGIDASVSSLGTN